MNHIKKRNSRFLECSPQPFFFLVNFSATPRPQRQVRQWAVLCIIVSFYLKITIQFYLFHICGWFLPQIKFLSFSMKPSSWAKRQDWSKKLWKLCEHTVCLFRSCSKWYKIKKQIFSTWSVRNPSQKVYGWGENLQRSIYKYQ